MDSQFPSPLSTASDIDPLRVCREPTGHSAAFDFPIWMQATARHAQTMAGILFTGTPWKKLMTPR
jgi:hypothetical protein